MDLITTHVCMTKDLGVHGNLFGGIMMSWLDEAGAAYAAQKSDSPRMTTVMVDRLEFVRPVRVGEVIRFYGSVEKLGTTSITLCVEARRHDVMTEEEETVCRTHVVYVKIDGDGHPEPFDESIRIRFQD